MSIKKCVNGSFVNDVYREYGTDTDTITSLPKTIIGDGQNISAYTIKGNMSQSGTPTPANPIYPSECGDKTANLYNLDKFTKSGGSYTISGAEITMEGNSNANNYYYPDIVYPAGTYTISFTGANGTTYMILGSSYDLANATINSTALSANSSAIATRLGVNYARYVQTFTTTKVIYSDVPFKVVFAPTATTWVISNVMMNIGGTAISYEPYGYKIPISLSSTPIYLSEPIRKISTYVDECPSTGTASRPIKKLVLTGQEAWTLLGRDTGRTVFSMALTSGSTVCVCSHIEYKSTYTSELNRVVIPNTKDKLYISIDNTLLGETTPSASDFQTYLATQYSNGTPVTIWYVLATPETESFTAPTLPTSGTAESFDVDTTLAPSEVSLTYHGWHEHSDTKYTT